jgi:hypothetical protein
MILGFLRIINTATKQDVEINKTKKHNNRFYENSKALPEKKDRCMLQPSNKDTRITHPFYPPDLY